MAEIIQKATDKKLQLKFQFVYVPQKNVVEMKAINLQDNQVYCQEMDPNIFSDLEYLECLLEQGQYEILSQDQNRIKIKICRHTIQLIQKQKLQTENLKERLEQALKQRSQLFKIIQTHYENIEYHQKLIKDLKASFQEFKKEVIQKIGDLKKTIIEERQKNNISQEQKSNLMSQLDQIIQPKQQNQHQIKTEIISPVYMKQNPQIEQNSIINKNDNNQSRQ